MLKFAHRRPEPSPRLQLRVPTKDSYYGSVSSLSKSSDFRGSTNSLSSSCSSANTSGTYQRTLKKRRAPLPPSMREANSAEHLSPPRKSSDASMVSDKSGQVGNIWIEIVEGCFLIFCFFYSISYYSLSLNGAGPKMS